MKRSLFYQFLFISFLAILLVFVELSSVLATDSLPNSSNDTSSTIITPAQSYHHIKNDNTLNAYISTHTWSKSYKNKLGITVAIHRATVQWTWDKGRIIRYNGMWQRNWTAPLFNYKSQKNSWNYRYTSNGETNQSVVFESSLPTPWGHIRGSKFTSRIRIAINGYGKSTGR